MKTVFLIILLLSQICGFSQSRSHGSVSKGSLEAGVRLPRKGANYKYFSRFSYAVLGRGWVHEKVERVVQSAYRECEHRIPGVRFRVMEASRKKGGRMWPHITHQNGMSIDFMTPLRKNNNQYRKLDGLGIWHYLLGFRKDGSWKGNRKVRIDFDTMARHILALDDAARKEGLRIKKVIFKIELQKAFFKTKSGREVKRRGIYFVRALPKRIDNLHDEHYHVDFAWR